MYGAFSPVDGKQFTLILPSCNASNFQIFLNEFSVDHANEFKIIVLDNGAFHKAKSLTIPDNIALIFLPPYSPELNPAELMWKKIKRNFTNKVFSSIDLLENFLCNEVNQLCPKRIKKTCAYPYIFLNNLWTI